MACDPDFANVVLLLHCDGTNGGTSFPDNSSYARAISTVGAPVTNTSIVKFGTASLDVTSFPSRLTFALASEINFTTNHVWTVDGWMYMPSGSSDTIFFNYAPGTSVWPVQLEINSNLLRAQGKDPGFGTAYSISGVTSVLQDQWNHFALVRDGNTLYLFLNGNLEGTASYSGDLAEISGPARFGGGSTSYGYFDEFRITIGTARWVAGFTPPTSPDDGACPPDTTVPDVVGETQADATDDIEAAALVVGAITSEFDAVIPLGSVISQDPVGGTTLPEGSSVDLVISLGPSDVEVPDVVGELLAAATSDIEDADLIVGTVTTVADPAPVGTVITQAPLAGSVVSVGTAIDLEIADGTTITTVPDVRGLSPATASGVLNAAELLLGAVVEAYDPTVPAGAIVSQAPGPGSPATVGSSVNVTVSRGPAPAVVPDVIGDVYEDAFAAIVAAGLRIGTVTVTTEPGAPLNVVRTEYPPAGSEVPYNTRVDLVITALVQPFDIGRTVISQYAQSPTLRRLVDNMAAYVDPRANLTNFYNFVWNVDTAVGFGLDIWGRIVGVSRLLRIPDEYDPIFGFDTGNLPYDWQPFGQGRFASNHDGTGGEAFELNDEAYRVLIFTKAMANIGATDAPSLNRLLQNLFPNRGNAFVQDLGGMQMTYVFEFELTSVERAIVSQSGVLPHPAGVGYSVIIDPVS